MPDRAPVQVFVGTAAATECSACLRFRALRLIAGSVLIDCGCAAGALSEIRALPTSMRCKPLLGLAGLLLAGCQATIPAEREPLSAAGPVFVLPAAPASDAASSPASSPASAPASDAGAASVAVEEMQEPAAGALDAASDAASAAQAADEPPPARFERNGYAVHWRQPEPRTPGDDVEVLHEGGGVRVLVSSSTGGGQVELRPERGVWPHEVQLQFQYAPGRPFETLEGLRFQVINPAHMAGDDLPPLVPEGFAVWQRDGRLAVSLPGGWLTGRQGLRVTWVDRYRH